MKRKQTVWLAVVTVAVLGIGIALAVWKTAHKPAGAKTGPAAQEAAKPVEPPKPAEPLGPQSDAKELSLAGIDHSDSPGDVKAALGEPLEKEQSSGPSPIDGWILYWETWVYQNARVTFYKAGEEGKARPELGVLTIRITGGDHQTHRGIRVGDAAEKVRTLYGEPDKTDSGEWWYQIEEGYTYISFTVSEGTVTAITAGSYID